MKVGSAQVRFSCDVARSEGYRHGGDGRPDEWYLYLGGGEEEDGEGSRVCLWAAARVGATFGFWHEMRRGGEATAAAANRAPTMATHSNSRGQIATGGKQVGALMSTDKWEGLFLHGEEASRVTTAAARARRPWAMSEPGNGGTSKSSLPDRSYRGREVRASRVSVPRYGIRTSGRRNCRYPPRSVRDGSRW